MGKEHFYSLSVRWTGNNGTGTSNYHAYDRSHIISSQEKPEITASSDPSFKGDKSKYNPEELLLAALSSCHMLWFLHLCADNGVVVVDYKDEPSGTMAENEKGGRFQVVVLKPTVTVKESFMIDQLDEMHKLAKEYCFISNSVNFPVLHTPVYLVAEKV